MDRLVIILLLTVAPPVFADDWGESDTWREVAFQSLLTVDWLQSRTVAGNPEKYSNYVETNKILGERPTVGQVNSYFLASSLLHYCISYYLPKDFREAFQYVSIGYEAGYVVNNFRAGIRISF
ncbi:MAG TPA: hypothetical protein VMJ33_05560 [Gallionella sp.]|nr:hypothetical protein [Gallionella sp.]